MGQRSTALTLLYAPLVVAACDATPPELVALSPSDRMVLENALHVRIDGSYSDDNPVTVRMFVDDTKQGTITSDCEDEGGECTFTHDWYTGDSVTGTHQWRIELEDDAGNITNEVREIELADLLVIDRVETATPPTGRLGIWIFDQANRVVGCVDTSSIAVRPNEVGAAIDADYTMFTNQTASSFRIEIWNEDETSYQTCPAYPPRATEAGRIGATPMRTTQQWVNEERVDDFGGVTSMTYHWRREGVWPPPSGGGDWGLFGGTGCSTSTGSVGLANGVLVGLAVLGSLRRRRR